MYNIARIISERLTIALRIDLNLNMIRVNKIGMNRNMSSNALKKLKS